MLLALTSGMVGSTTLTVMAKAIYGLYGMTGSMNTFFDGHLREMKGSDNQMISQTGAVLEGAKFGFGLGYMSSVVIVAMGQHLLGNTLGAVSTVASAVALTNPVAMTCAAVGAIYYGWHALSLAQQNSVLESVTRGLELGAELVKSVVQFLITKTKEVMSSQTLAEFKVLMKEYAAVFGKTLYDITGKVSDLVVVAAEKVGQLSRFAGEAATSAVDTTTSALKVALTKTTEAASSAAESTSGAFKGAYEKTGGVATTLATSARQSLDWTKPVDTASSNPPANP
jgi:hypothetical protein